MGSMVPSGLESVCVVGAARARVPTGLGTAMTPGGLCGRPSPCGRGCTPCCCHAARSGLVGGSLGGSRGALDTGLGWVVCGGPWWEASRL